MKPKSSPQHLLEQAAQIQRMERGKLSILREGPEGPYFNHQCRQDGKNVSRYVPRDQVQATQEAIDGYNQFTQLIEEYVDLSVAKTRAEIAARSKKKTETLAPSLSLPKTPKSNT